MNYLINQRGSTLVIALLIIVLFSVLGFGLITLNTSASKQFDNKEQKVQARHFAEMGIVHYKSEANIAVKTHNSVIKGIEGNPSLKEDEKVKMITDANKNLCTNLENVTSINNEDSNYDITIIDCSPGTDSLVDISVKSTGKSSQGKVVNIELDLSVNTRGTLPGGTGGSRDTPPAEPAPPTSNINKIWEPCDKKDCVTTVSDFTDVSAIDTVKSKKGNMTFNNSLIMNNFRVDGGNGLEMSVKKDLYLKGTLDVQNHACIVVQGNFTAITSIEAINKFYLFVYGDANLPGKITFNNGNNKIFVSGDVYIGGVKQPKPNGYDSVPTTFSDCSLPGAPTPGTTGGTPDSTIDGNFVLTTNEYRY